MFDKICQFTLESSDDMTPGTFMVVDDSKAPDDEAGLLDFGDLDKIEDVQIEAWPADATVVVHPDDMKTILGFSL